MHIKFSIVIVTWLLGGGHVVYNGFELFGSSKAKTTIPGQGTIIPKLTETKLPERGSRLALIFESIFGTTKKIGDEKEDIVQTKDEEAVKSAPFLNFFFGGEFSTAGVAETADESKVVNEPPPQASSSFIDYLLGRSAPSTVAETGDGRKVVSEPPQASSSFIDYLLGRLVPSTDEQKKEDLDSDAEEKRQASMSAHWTDFFAQVKMDILTLKLFLIETLQQNGVAGVIGMALDICQHHAVFLVGVVIPFFAPGMWPWFGRLFWSFVAIVQFACGVKKSKLAQHLGMKWAAGDAVTTTTTTPSGDAIMNSARTPHGETGIAASNVVDNEARMANGVSTPSEDIDVTSPFTPPRTTQEEERSSENESTCSTTTTSTATTVVEVAASAAAAAKSLPVIEGHPFEATQRSCNSDTFCKDGAVIKKRDGMERIASRPRRLGLHINDIRRVAPPRDATTSIRGAILEIEQRRRAKEDSVRLLEQGEHQYPELFEGEDAEIVRRGLADAAVAGECRGKTGGETPLQRACNIGDGADVAAVGEAKK